MATYQIIRADIDLSINEAAPHYRVVYYVLPVP